MEKTRRRISQAWAPLMEYSGAGGKLIHEKKPAAKNLVTCPFTKDKDGCIAGRSCLLTAVCFSRQEEMEARDQGQLDDLLQLHRQSHEKERDEGTKPRVIDFFLFSQEKPSKRPYFKFS